jgi:hypothetical protein
VSAIGGGSVAAINCSNLQVTSSSFTDSLVLGSTLNSNTSALTAQYLMAALGPFTTPESVVARGGALLVLPAAATGSTCTIASCTFQRCRISVSGAVVQTSALLPSLLGGAVYVAFPLNAASQPKQQGTSVTISASSFIACTSYFVAFKTTSVYNLGGAVAVQGFSTVTNSTPVYSTTTSQIQMSGLNFQGDVLALLCP